MMQIRLGRGETTAEGWTWQELVADREKCFRAGLRIARRSFSACRSLPIEHRLSAYATGSCSFPMTDGIVRSTPVGHTKSASRIAVARKLLARLALPPIPQSDEQGATTKDPQDPSAGSVRGAP
jgi:hypothetical protein